MNDPKQELATAIVATIHALMQNFPDGTAFMVTIAKFEGDQMHAMTGTNAHPDLAKTMMETARATVEKVGSMNETVDAALRISKDPSLN